MYEDRPKLHRLAMAPTHGADHRVENLYAVDADKLGFGRAFRMRHHANYIAARVADAGDIVQRSVGIGSRRNFATRGRIAKHHAIVAVQFIQRSLIAEVVPFHVADGNGQYFSLRTSVGEWSRRILHSHLHRLANVFQSGVAHQRSGQKPRLAQDLKAVADSQHQSSAVRKAPHRFHHGRELGNRASPQIVAVRKTSGDDDGVAVLQIMRLVPQESHRLPDNLLNGPESIVIAVGTGKDDDAEFHLALSLNPVLGVGFVVSLARPPDALDFGWRSASALRSSPKIN